MRAWKVRVTYLMLVSISLQSLAIGPASADPFFEKLFRLKKELAYHGKEPAMCGSLAIETLAENIDWVEHHIDKYGSIVAKQPDVWGEARMTKHRDEYERMMFEQLNQFQFRINAAITQSDSSFLAQAFALSAAVEEGGDAPATDIRIATADANGQGTQPAADGDVVAVTAKADATISEPGLKIEGAENIGLEPTLFLDQLSRYLQHLHELRRINEGDDTSDSPGYAMNLVRIPVSMLPGKITREGFGAEVTITGTPIITEDLLPNTFRNLVVNDLVDQLGLPLVKTVEHPELLDLWRTNRNASKVIDRARLAFIEWNFLDNPTDRAEVSKLVADVVDNPRARASIQRALDEASGDEQGLITQALMDPKRTDRIISYGDQIRADVQYATDQIAEFIARMQRHARIADPQDLAVAKLSLHNAIISMGIQATVADAIDQQRQSRQALNPSSPKSVIYEDVSRALKQIEVPDYALPEQLRQEQAPIEQPTSTLEERIQRQQAVQREPSPRAQNPQAESQARARIVAGANNLISAREVTEQSIEEVFHDFANVLERVSNIATDVSSQMDDEIGSTAVSVSGRARRASQPVPPSHVVSVYGRDLFYSSANFFCEAYSGRQIRWAGDPYCSTVGPDGKPATRPVEYRVNLLDVQKWLQAELAAGHELLSQPNHLQLWYDLANPRSGLAVAIRSGHFKDGTTATCSSSTPASPFCAVGRPPVHGEILLEGPESLLIEGASPLAEAAPYAVGTLVSTLGANASVEAYRNYFFDRIHKHFSSCPTHEKLANSSIEVVEQMAWAIVVESALLNQRLNEDVRKVATAKQCGCMPAGGQDLSFFLPEVAANPESGLAEEFAAATQVFQEYVRCRWPIHVFAIDPREQDQNVADISRRHRELQFALALGFVSGQISARSMTQFTRELNTEIQTISLNRTAVGFSHGNDTFGWRFFPRVQALDVPGTAGAIWQSVRGTPRDADIRNRQLEPGMRECVAIVLMPSFVPYVDFDVRSNWFKLTNPKNAALTMKDTMKLSRAITAMRNSRAQADQCAHCYRVGEVERLMKRIDQLDRELPLQTMRSQIPYENTLGGFEMFNTGITDLAPELEGWYGAPGVVVGNEFKCGCYKQCEHCKCTDCDNCPLCECPKDAEGKPVTRPYAEPPAICEGEGTTLFLVGDHLSVHDTKIIAGGVCIPHVRLVSRQIVRVTIPSCVKTVDVDGKPYVAVYAATPYGVTNHLHIPVAPSPAAAKPPEQVALEAKVDGLVKQVAALNTVTVALKSGLAKLDFDAACIAPNQTIELRPKFPARINVDFSAGIPEGSEIRLAIKHQGQFLGSSIPLPGVGIFSASASTYQLELAQVQGEILDRLVNAQPPITITSFNAEGKHSAVGVLYYRAPNCCDVPIVSNIPIEITLVQKCCETPPQAAPERAAPVVPAPPTPPTETVPRPSASPELIQPAEDVSGIEQGSSNGATPASSSQVKPCSCPTALGTQLIVR